MASDSSGSQGRSLLLGEGLPSLGFCFTGDSRSCCSEANPTAAPCGCSEELVAAGRLLAAACDCRFSAAFWKKDSIALAGFCLCSLLGLLKNLTMGPLPDVAFAVSVPSGWVSLVRKAAMPAERCVVASENLLAESSTDMSGGDLQGTEQPLRHHPGKQNAL